MTKTTKILSDTILNELIEYSEAYSIINSPAIKNFKRIEREYFRYDLQAKQMRIRELYDTCDPLTKNIVNTYIANNIKPSNN